MARAGYARFTWNSAYVGFANTADQADRHTG
jgi:hypothetical protein